MSRGLEPSVLLDLVFVAGAAPLAGLIVDRTASYATPLTIHIVAFTLSAVIFLLLARMRTQSARLWVEA